MDWVSVFTNVLLLCVGMASIQSVELDGGCTLVGTEVRCKETHLTYIPETPTNVTSLYYSHNYLPHVRQATFENISDPGHLISLYLLFNGIRTITVDSLDRFTGLTYLDLSGNSMYVEYLQPLLGVLCHRNIILVLDDMGHVFPHEDTFSLMNDCDLHELYLRHDHFKYVSQNLTKHLDNIKTLNFERNNMNDFHLSYMKGLEVLSLDYNHLRHFPNFCAGDNTSSSLVPKIKTLYITHNKIRDIGPQQFECLSSLKLLDISHNHFAVFPDHMLSHLPKIQSLKIRSNHGHLARVKAFAFSSKSLKKLAFSQDGPATSIFPSINDTFKHLPNLTSLELGFIDMLHLPMSSFYGLFAPLDKLEELYCFECKIHHDPSTILRNKDHLIDIDFGVNLIETMHGAKLRSNQFLKYVNLKENRLAHITSTTFPVDLLNRLERVDFSENPFVCDCSLAWFIGWLKSADRSKIGNIRQYQCASPQKYVGRPLSDVEFSYFECHPLKTWAWVTIGGLPTALVILGLSFMAYRNRWNIKHYIYLLRWKRKNYIPIDGANLLYDAFVSYDQSDSHWVVDRLIPILEDEANCRLCVHERDFHIGAYISDNIANRIEESKRMILVLSDAFATSGWCMFELKVALSKHIEDDFEVIVVLFQPIAARNMDTSINTLLNMTTYLEWTDDIVGEELFWNKLRDAMGVRDY